jgi:DNA invertase Pin-like site-specific DNA recombinase
VAYVRSQAHEGWVLAHGRYDDGGYSGASLDRPALQTLLEAVRQRRIDVIVVYKVDRLTRSLADFAKLVELFDAHNVSFISITQSFNTTTSMGRLTLNMLLSFAQFEREVTGERIRDKIAASKKKGLWVGGVVPLGYRVVDRKLAIDEKEAPIVRLIFERYCALGSMIAVMRELRERGVVTRRRTLSSGRTIGGIAFTKGPLAYLLKNRMYLGEINHGQMSRGGLILRGRPFAPPVAPIRGSRQCGAQISWAASQRRVDPMSVKLSDTQLIILSAAAHRGDDSLTPPEKLRGVAAHKVAAKLIAAGLVKEVKAKAGTPVWRRDEQNG